MWDVFIINMRCGECTFVVRCKTRKEARKQCSKLSRGIMTAVHVPKGKRPLPLLLEW